MNFSCYKNFYICTPYKLENGEKDDELPTHCEGGKAHRVLEVNGELAQLARALAWHARGHRFEPGILH